MTDMGEAFRKAGHKTTADRLVEVERQAVLIGDGIEARSFAAFLELMRTDPQAGELWLAFLKPIMAGAIAACWKNIFGTLRDEIKESRKPKKSTGATGHGEGDTQNKFARPPVETLQRSSPSNGDQRGIDTHYIDVPGSAVESQPSPPAKGDHDRVDTQYNNVSGSVADHISEPSDGGQIAFDTHRIDVPSPAQGANKLPAKAHIPPRGTIPTDALVSIAKRRWRELKERSIGEFTDAELEKIEERTEHEANFIGLVRDALLKRAPGVPATKRQVALYLDPMEIELLWDQAASAKAA